MPENMEELELLQWWQYKGCNFDLVNDVGDSIGLIYENTFANQQMYVGGHLYNAATPTYVGSGSLVSRMTKNYGKNGIKRNILHLCDTIEEIKYWEEYYIKIRNAVEDEKYLNMVKGGYSRFKTIPIRPIAVEKENGEKRIFANEFQASMLIGDFLGKEIKVSNCTIISWVERKTLIYEQHMKDIYYADATRTERIKYDDKRYWKLAKSELNPLVIEFEDGTRRLFADARVAEKKLFELIGLKFDRCTLIRNAKNGCLGFENWKGVKNIWHLKFEVNDTMHELEAMRQQTRDSLEKENKRKKSPENRMKQSEGTKKYNAENPDKMKKHREFMIEYCKKNRIPSKFWLSNGICIICNGTKDAAETFGFSYGTANAWLHGYSKSFRKLKIVCIEYKGQMIE